MSQFPFRSWRTGSALALMLAIVTTTGALAQAAPAPEPPTWTQTTLTEPVVRLFTPSSGALLARTVAGLTRSDDAGLTWRTVSLPAAPAQDQDAIVVDPTNHATIYLAAADGLYKTDDDAASWRMVLPADPTAPTFTTLTVSPANPSILYVMFTSPTSNSLQFRRSADGGQTWEMLPNAGSLPPGAIPQKCAWTVSLLQPHPTDPDRLFRAAACVTRSYGTALKESRDGGHTLSGILYEHPLSQVTRLAGNQPDAPQRIYLGVNKDYHGGGSLVVASDDDGVTWQTLLEYSGGGGMTGGGPNVTVSGLALDPASSDRLLLGLNASRGDWAVPPSLRLSLDGGASWLDASPEGIGRISDVAFGIDGRMQFAASETGVWRASMP